MNTLQKIKLLKYHNSALNWGACLLIINVVYFVLSDSIKSLPFNPGIKLFLLFALLILGVFSFYKKEVAQKKFCDFLDKQ